MVKIHYAKMLYEDRSSDSYGSKENNQSATKKRFSSNRFLFFYILSIILEISVFKYFYPRVSFFVGDSYCYVDEAIKNPAVSIYPIGYPNFLGLVNLISSSDTFLFIIQYLLLQLSLLCLLLTVKFFYTINNRIAIIATVFLFINPIFLYLSNTVSSDNLFFSLSCLWMTSLLLIINGITYERLLFHGIILFILFTVRYNAIYYPLVSTIIIVICKANYKQKIIGILIYAIMIGSFVYFNMNKYYELCKIRQFSPFSGWQMVNNALYSYRKVPNNEYKKVPLKFYNLDRIIRNYFNSSRNIHPNTDIGEFQYMWDPYGPLWEYALISLNGENQDVVYTWSKVSELYKEYGFWLMKNYPIEFSKYYLYPNVKKFWSPPTEFLSFYNSGLNDVPLYVQDWFKYRTPFISSKVNNTNIQLGIVKANSIMSTLINILFYNNLPFIKKLKYRFKLS